MANNNVDNIFQVTEMVFLIVTVLHHLLLTASQTMVTVMDLKTETEEVTEEVMEEVTETVSRMVFPEAIYRLRQVTAPQ